MGDVLILWAAIGVGAHIGLLHWLAKDSPPGHSPWREPISYGMFFPAMLIGPLWLFITWQRDPDGADNG